MQPRGKSRIREKNPVNFITGTEKLGKGTKPTLFDIARK
jgi:hypothetical protein